MSNKSTQHIAIGPNENHLIAMEKYVDRCIQEALSSLTSMPEQAPTSIKMVTLVFTCLQGRGGVRPGVEIISHLKIEFCKLGGFYGLRVLHLLGCWVGADFEQVIICHIRM